MTSEIAKKISSLVRAIAGNRDTLQKRAEAVNLPAEMSETRKGEILLFADAVTSGKIISMEDDSIGTPVEVFMEEKEAEAPKRYSIWPNLPGERKSVGVQFIKVAVINPVDISDGIAPKGSYAVRVRPVSNDDRINCFYAQLPGKKTMRPKEKAPENAAAGAGGAPSGE